MLAYVFWHWPRPGVDRGDYERRLAALHRSLAADPPAGFVGSAALAVAGLDWLPAVEGYEDWYLVDDWAALGALNDAAVAAAHRWAHDAVAERAAGGAGGLYRLLRGEPALAAPATWSERPLDGEGDGATWERQLVLGPAPRFCRTGVGPPRRSVWAAP